MTDRILLILVLLLGGLALTMAEVITPSFGLLAVGAVVCFGMMVYYCFEISSALGVAAIIGLLIGMPFVIAFALRVMPNTPIGRRLMPRKFRAPPGESLPESGGFTALVGKRGQTVGVLRPGGFVEIDGVRVPASAEAGFIGAGETVEVIRASGMNVVVRPVGAEG